MKERFCARQPRLSTEVDEETSGRRNTKEGDGRTIPERMATYFLTTISLANLFSPGSTNEVEAAGLSETATTIPLRKPGDDILPQPEKSTVVQRESGGREGEGIEGELVPGRSILSKTFPGR